jgi:putative membrane protein
MRADGGGPKALAATSNSATSLAAEDFIDKAVGADLYQLEAAKIAAAKAHAPEVRAFAQSMAEEHATSRALLNEAARTSGQAVPVPTEPTERQQSMLHLLARGEQGDFDRTYMEQQVQTHEETLVLVNAYAQSGAVPSIRQAAAGLAPDLQQDLKKAQALESALDKP